MGFKGLFIGIDRYQSSRVAWLSCAQKDAEALHALFSDTLGTGATILTDQSATRAAIEEEFRQLATCDVDDVVVIGFSGHGTPSHQLVSYDTDPSDLENTTISLETLVDWFSRIPATRLICFLDCCFSGGMGSKVLQIDAVARHYRAVAPDLEEMSGEGRLILTASAATEEAYETPKLGHGLLTYYLLEALQGVEEVRQAGKISVYQLLHYVTQRVSDGAAQLGKVQRPTLRGKLDGELTWPIFKPGPLYRQKFPTRTRPLITSDLASLMSYGFPPALLQTWAQAIPALNSLQIEAINEYNLLEGQHLVVSAPTSSGKTLIGELAALKGTLNRQRAIFLLPLKALVNDKFRQFTKLYGTFGIKTIEATGDTADITPLIRGQYDICLMTYEKFAAVLLTNPHVLNQVGTVIIDEAQMIANETRGANLEFLLTLLRMRRQQGIEPQMIALSAVIGDTNGFEHWLNARLLKRIERPVPLDEGLLLANGQLRYIDAQNGEEKVTGPVIQRMFLKDSAQDWLIPLAQKLVHEGKQLIVFRETKAEARNVARYLALHLGLPPAQSALNSLPIDDPTITSQTLREVLQGGVAYHIADLSSSERRAIEEEFRKPDSEIRVIVATTTLAMGINTPAEAVVIIGLTHPGNNPYSIAEYKNMVGRAGRLGLSQRGTSYLFALDSHDEQYLWQRYITGTPEDLTSRLLAGTTDLRSLIIRSLVMLQRQSTTGVAAEEVISFLEASFGVFQLKQQQHNWQWDRSQFIEKLHDLESHGLIKQLPSGTYELTQLGWVAGESVIEIESVVRLVDCLRPLGPSAITDPTLLAAAQVTVELDQVLFPLNKKSTQKEPITWSSTLTNQGVPTLVLSRLQNWVQDQHQSTLRAKKAVACLLYITNRPMIEIEKTVTQFGGGLNGAAGAIIATASRTCDILSTVARVAEILHPGLELGDRLNRLLVRLNLGVPAAAIDLATLAGTQLGRGDYLRLLEAGLCNLEAITTDADQAILNCLDGNLEKLALIHRAVEQHRQAGKENASVPLTLEPYVG
jgi:helicase